MHDAGTVFGRHVIAGDNAECPFSWIHPGDELFVMKSYEVLAFQRGDNFKRYQFVAFVIRVQRQSFSFGVEEMSHQRYSNHYRLFFAAVGVVGMNDVVVDFRSYCEGCVRGKCPGRCGPRQEISVAEALHYVERVGAEELGHAGGVLYVAVTSRLVELVCAQACAGCGRIRLNRVSFV